MKSKSSFQSYVSNARLKQDLFLPVQQIKKLCEKRASSHFYNPKAHKQYYFIQQTWLTISPQNIYKKDSRKYATNQTKQPNK